MVRNRLSVDRGAKTSTFPSGIVPLKPYGATPTIVAGGQQTAENRAKRERREIAARHQLRVGALRVAARCDVERDVAVSRDARERRLHALEVAEQRSTERGVRGSRAADRGTPGTRSRRE